MKQTALFFVFLLTLLSSCCNKTCQKSTDNNPLDSLVLVDTTEMKSAFLGCIHRFIKQYPKDSTFILKCGYGYEDRGIFTNGSISTVTFFLSILLIMARLWVENGLLMICILHIILRLTTASSSSAHVQIPL